MKETELLKLGFKKGYGDDFYYFTYKTLITDANDENTGDYIVFMDEGCKEIVGSDKDITDLVGIIKRIKK